MTLAILLVLAFPVFDDLPDGHVERWMQVTIRDDVTQIRYAVGFNDNTLRSLLQDYGISEIPEDLQWQQAAIETALKKGFSNSIEIHAGGEALSAEVKSVQPSGRHHLRFFVDLEVQLPPFEDSLSFIVRDRAFEKYAGNIRYGLKTQSKLILGQSNVAALVARAEKIDAGKLEDREAATTIKATIEK